MGSEAHGCRRGNAKHSGHRVLGFPAGAFFFGWPAWSPSQGGGKFPSQRAGELGAGQEQRRGYDHGPGAIMREAQIRERFLPELQIELANVLFERLVSRTLAQLLVQSHQLGGLRQSGYLAMGLTEQQQPAHQQHEHARGNRHCERALQPNGLVQLFHPLAVGDGPGTGRPSR